MPLKGYNPLKMVYCKEMSKFHFIKYTLYLNIFSGQPMKQRKKGLVLTQNH